MFGLDIVYPEQSFALELDAANILFDDEDLNF